MSEINPEEIFDTRLLRALADQARKRGDNEVANRALRQICEIEVEPEFIGLEREFRVVVAAIEEVYARMYGRRVRANRTRNKMVNVGYHKVLEDWAVSNKPTVGFRYLIDSGMHDLTGEAVVVRNPGSFSTEIVASARQRLADAGVAFPE